MNARLTRTELEITRLVAAGMSNGEIAAARGVNRGTVGKQLQRLREKLEIDESLRSFLRRKGVSA